MTDPPPLARRLLAELLGSAFLAALVIGSGIAPASAPAFILAQAVGGALALAAIRVLFPHVTSRVAAAVVVPHAS